MKVVTLLSGGLDSVTLLYHLLDRGDTVHAMSFDYGQRHEKEIEVARNFTRNLDVDHSVVVLGVGHPAGPDFPNSPLGAILRGSSLTDSSVPVPDGHYAAESMKATVVPNRNAIMLSIAYAAAISDKAHAVMFAAHAGDHAIYPDCRPEFVGGLDAALQSGNRWDAEQRLPYIDAPFLFLSKASIARRAVDLGVPIEKTWSCYKGGELHCGTCGTCVERREALNAVDVPGFEDPTLYLDSTTMYEAPDHVE